MHQNIQNLPYVLGSGEPQLSVRQKLGAADCAITHTDYLDIRNMACSLRLPCSWMALRPALPMWVVYSRPSKGTVRPRRDHDGPEGEYRCSSTLSLTSAYSRPPKGTVHPRRDHDGPEGEYRCSSTLSLTSAYSRPLQKSKWGSIRSISLTDSFHGKWCRCTIAMSKYALYQYLHTVCFSHIALACFYIHCKYTSSSKKI